MSRAMKQRKLQIAGDASEQMSPGGIEPTSAERPSWPPDINIRSSATVAPNPLLLPESRNYVLIRLEGVSLKALRFSDGAGDRLTSEHFCLVSVGPSLRSAGEVEYEITFEADGVEKTVSGKVRRL